MTWLVSWGRIGCKSFRQVVGAMKSTLIVHHTKRTSV